MEGGRFSHQEEPRRRNNFSLGLHAEIVVRAVNRREGSKEQRQPVERLPAIFVLFVPSTGILIAKAVYMVLGSS